MSDTAWLFAVLAGLYLVECVAWIRPGEIAFRGVAGRTLALARDRGVAVGERGWLLPLMPLPPLGTLLVVPEGPADGAGVREAWRRDPERFRAAAARERLAAFRGRTLVLRVLANAIWCVLFVLAPLAIVRWGLPMSWRPLLALLAGLDLALAFEIGAVTRRPEYGGRIDWNHVIVGALSPPAAVRVADSLARVAAGPFHGLALARASCAPGAADDAVRRVLYAEPRPADAELRALLRALETEPRTLWDPPARESAAALAYCPRCHGQFVSSPGTCDDCCGVPRVAFPTRA